MSKKLETNGRKLLPGLWQLGKDTWVIRAQRICLRTGRKLNRRRLVQQATRTEALAALEALRRDLEKNEVREQQPPTTSQRTLESFATSWLTMKKQRSDLAKNTQKRYATALDHLSPWLLQLPLSEITRGDVQQWLVASRAKYSPTTINGWLRVLRACLAEAVADGHIASNVATQVRPLKEEVDLEETNSLTAAELGKLLGTLDRQDNTIHAIATTQAVTGVRWGEATALKWEDYDEANRVLRIRRAVCERELRSMTKTGKARTVGVPELLVQILRKHRERLVKDQHPGLSSGLMFPSNKGTPLSSGRISDALRAACEKAGIKKRFTSHGFRRSLTDLLRNAHVDPVVAAGLTGHETERMRRHYSTVRDLEAVDVSDRIAKLVQPSWESPEERRQPSSESPEESPKESPEESLAQSDETPKRASAS
jgi:integrase